MIQFQNIVSNAAILGGKPCIKGTRISVELIMEWLGTGGTPDVIAAKHPLLTPELVMEAIRYVARFTNFSVQLLTQTPYPFSQKTVKTGFFWYTFLDKMNDFRGELNC